MGSGYRMIWLVWRSQILKVSRPLRLFWLMLRSLMSMQTRLCAIFLFAIFEIEKRDSHSVGGGGGDLTKGGGGGEGMDGGGLDPKVSLLSVKDFYQSIISVMMCRTCFQIAGKNASKFLKMTFQKCSCKIWPGGQKQVTIPPSCDMHTIQVVEEWHACTIWGSLQKLGRLVIAEHQSGHVLNIWKYMYSTGPSHHCHVSRFYRFWLMWRLYH